MDTQQLKNIITTNRPNLKDNTINSYTSILKSMYKMIYPNNKTIDITKYQDTKTFSEYLMNNFDPSVRKAYFNALVVLTELDDYRTQMMSDVEETKNMKSDNMMTEKQQENQVTRQEIDALLRVLKQDVKLIYKNKSYTPTNLLTIQNYVLLNLFSKIEPRRSKDYWMFKIRNIDINVDNYLDGDEMTFNSYKTAFSYGQQRIKLPSTLLRMIKKYIAVIPSDQNYLFFTVTGKPMNSTLLNQRFNSIFGGRHVSVNSFRHAFLSEKYQSYIDLKDSFHKMGSSMSNADTYIQRLK
jgi:integrase